MPTAQSYQAVRACGEAKIGSRIPQCQFCNCASRTHGMPAQLLISALVQLCMTCLLWLRALESAWRAAHRAVKVFQRQRRLRDSLPGRITQAGEHCCGRSDNLWLTFQHGSKSICMFTYLQNAGTAAACILTCQRMSPGLIMHMAMTPCCLHAGVTGHLLWAGS